MNINDSELFGRKADTIKINVENSKELIERGLKYFFGEKAAWLPEYDQIKDWLINNNGKGLLCIGDGGRGKTFITEKILSPIISKFYCHLNVHFVRGYSMAEDYESGTGTILIIDDVGVEREQNVFGEKKNTFNQIVYEAERYGWLLIVTTNLTIEELKDKYGERTLDRLRALTTPVVFRGKSLRNR